MTPRFSPPGTSSGPFCPIDIEIAPFSLDEMLADEVMRNMMASDHVDERSLLDLLHQARRD